MTRCDYNHEGYCTAEHFKCSLAKGNGFWKQCTARPQDLVDGCMMCEIRPADAPFPNDEYCKQCAKMMEDE